MSATRTYFFIKFFIFLLKIRFQNRRMKLKKEIQAIKELNEQEKQAQAQKAALVAQGHSIEGT
jgi:cell division protein FtsB